MPSGKPINWDCYDVLLLSYLPNMTITAFVDKYLPNISAHAVGRRAKKLNIKPLKPPLSKDHKDKISKSLLKDDPTIIQQIRHLRDEFSLKEISQKLGIDAVRICRIIKRHDIKLSNDGVERARKNAAIGWKKAIKNSQSKKSREKRSINMALRKSRGLKTYKGSTVTSVKGGIINTKSSYETAYVHKLDANCLVESFEYENIIIKYEYNGLNRTYIPDFSVKFIDGHVETHEVKPKQLLKDERNKAKFEAARRNSIPFVLITEDDLFA